MAELKDLWKKGTAAPLPADIVEAGLAIDIANKKAYSKAQDGTVFQISGNEETLTSISYDNVTKIISYIDEDNITTDLDVSDLLDDTNLARIESGVYNDTTKVITLTRDDLTTIDIDTSTLTVTETLTVLTFNDVTKILSYTDEDGTLNTIDLSSVSGVETLTTLTFDPNTSELTYTDENGTANIVNIDNSTIGTY